jgi:D-glycero-D-manno-heptose 1,7-bisphosphate phosphatase
MHPAIFLDRDGVIIENCDDYVRQWEDVQILPGALEALSRASRSKYKIVIVTNQAGVGRGMIPLDVAHSINQRLVEIISASGGRVDGVYMCPHKAEDKCACRKPQPGMLLQAARDLDLDLTQSIMIGDAVTDLQAARAAGVPQVYLVCTGRGAAQSQLASLKEVEPYQLANHVDDAITQVLK